MRLIFYFGTYEYWNLWEFTFVLDKAWSDLQKKVETDYMQKKMSFQLFFADCLARDAT